MTNQNRYEGLWVTSDGHIRHALQPNGRYVEARGKLERAYEGRYEIRGDHIDYWDDTEFTADGDFIDGVLHHAGMIDLPTDSARPHRQSCCSRHPGASRPQVRQRGRHLGPGRVSTCAPNRACAYSKKNECSFF